MSRKTRPRPPEHPVAHRLPARLRGTQPGLGKLVVAPQRSHGSHADGRHRAVVVERDNGACAHSLGVRVRRRAEQHEANPRGVQSRCRVGTASRCEVAGQGQDGCASRADVAARCGQRRLVVERVACPALDDSRDGPVALWCQHEGPDLRSLGSDRHHVGGQRSRGARFDLGGARQRRRQKRSRGNRTGHEDDQRRQCCHSPECLDGHNGRPKQPEPHQAQPGTRPHGDDRRAGCGERECRRAHGRGEAEHRDDQGRDPPARSGHERRRQGKQHQRHEKKLVDQRPGQHRTKPGVQGSPAVRIR